MVDVDIDRRGIDGQGRYRPYFPVGGLTVDVDIDRDNSEVARRHPEGLGTENSTQSCGRGVSLCRARSHPVLHEASKSLYGSDLGWSGGQLSPPIRALVFLTRNICPNPAPLRRETHTFINCILKLYAMWSLSFWISQETLGLPPTFSTSHHSPRTLRPWRLLTTPRGV